MAVSADPMHAEAMDAQRLAHLERDRWPEFERELLARRPRRIYFDVCSWRCERPRWAWLIGRCRRWAEVERVLNKHNVDYRWRVRRHALDCGDADVYRLS